MKPFAILVLGTCLLGLLGCSDGTKQEAQPADTSNIAGKIATTLDAAIAQAQAGNKPILVVAYEGSSEGVDQVILSEPMITERSPKIVIAKLNAATQAQAMTKLEVTEFPTLLILKPDGSVSWRKSGPNPPEVVAAIDQALGVAPASE